MGRGKKGAESRKDIQPKNPCSQLVVHSQIRVVTKGARASITRPSEAMLISGAAGLVSMLERQRRGSWWKGGVEGGSFVVDGGCVGEERRGRTGGW